MVFNEDGLFLGNFKLRNLRVLPLQRTSMIVLVEHVLVIRHGIKVVARSSSFGVEIFFV